MHMVKLLGSHFLDLFSEIEIIFNKNVINWSPFWKNLLNSSSMKNEIPMTDKIKSKFKNG